jgi:ribonuclease HII
MNSTIKLATAALSATFALAGVARAEEVRIDLAGKDARTIHAEIVQAAYQVCRDVAVDSIQISSRGECVADTIEKADADARSVSAAHVQKAELAPSLRGER